MSFPATTLALSETWQKMQGTALQIRKMCETAVVDLQNPTSAQYILSIHNRLVRSQLELADYAAIPGLAQYVKDQLADQGINIVTEYQGMQAAIQDVVDEIASTFPADENGFLLAAKFSSNGLQYRTFLPAQTSAIATKLNAVVASIG